MPVTCQSHCICLSSLITQYMLLFSIALWEQHWSWWFWNTEAISLLYFCVCVCSRHCHVAIRHPLQPCCLMKIRASCRRLKRAQQDFAVVANNAAPYRLFAHHLKHWNVRWVRPLELVSPSVLVPCSGSRHTPLPWQLTITRWCNSSITTMVSLTSSHLQLRQAAVGAPLSYLLVVRSLSCISLPELLLLPVMNSDRALTLICFCFVYAWMMV